MGLREALRSIAAEVERGRPETSPTDPRFAVRRRKLEQARVELVEGLSPKCENCQHLESVHAEASSKFFREIEHLRRALAKMLDAAKDYMPANVLRNLKESLQLDVRYLTKPEEGEGGPLPPVPVPDVVDQSELIERLKRQIADQDRQLVEKKYTIKDLEEELRKLQEQLKEAGMVVSPARQRPKKAPPEHREIQTDPWMPFPPKQELAPVAEGPKIVEQPTVVKPKKEKKPKAVEQPDSDSSDETPAIEKVKKPKKVPKKEEVPVVVSTGIDPEVVRKLQAELELLKMKLAAAERELAQMQELKDEIERLKALLREKDKKKPAESKPRKTFEDKCVGNGPGWSKSEEPKQEVKKTEKVRERPAAEQPSVAPSEPPTAPSTAEPDAPPLARTQSGPALPTEPVLPKKGPGKTTTWSNVASAKQLPREAPAEAEPYLTQVWEQHPKGHKAPVKRELIKLGAVSPQQQKLSTLEPVEPVEPENQSKRLSMSASDATMKLPEGWHQVEIEQEMQESPAAG